MRQAFCNGLVQQALLPEFVFLTGDLGFKALEPLQDAHWAHASLMPASRSRT